MAAHISSPNYQDFIETWSAAALWLRAGKVKMTFEAFYPVRGGVATSVGMSSMTYVFIRLKIPE